jgi:hypothetical protein
MYVVYDLMGKYVFTMEIRQFEVGKPLLPRNVRMYGMVCARKRNSGAMGMMYKKK